MAWLFELGGSIWGAALLHWVVQGTVKIVVVEGAELGFAATWMVASAVLPFAVFAFRPAGVPFARPPVRR